MWALYLLLWVRIRAQFSWPDLGLMRSPLLQLVAHLLIHINSLTLVFIRCSDVSVFICKNILNFSLSWRVQKIIHDTDSYAFEPATILPNISCLVFESLMFPIMSYILQTCSNSTNSTNFLFCLMSLCYFP